jgi:hypothetical protein
MTRFLVVLAISLLGPTGCAVNPRGPEVESICIDVPQETSQEVAYVRRRVAEFFQESGFSLSEGECDVLVEYAVFGAFQGELFERRGFWSFSSGYWSQEGIVAVTYQDKKLIEDRPVELRGYARKQDLLDDLAWEVVEPVTKTFKPASSRR